MSTIRVGTVAALLAGLALSASPVVAQDRREGGDRRDGQAQGGRRNPNAGNQGSGDNGARARGRGRDDNNSQANGSGQAQADRGDRGNRDGANNTAEGRRQARPRTEPQNRDGDRNRDRNDGRRADRNDTNRDWDRNRDRGRPIIIEPRSRDNRYSPRYVPRYNARANRVYVVPYGYRPQGYRPGWNVNLYFGRSYGYASRGYDYGYDPRSYGYYAIPPGFAYGSLRIVDAPRDAQVFVDGYYAGVVDDYDGVFQHLNLEPGTHRIEIDVYPGAPPLEFDVNLAPGQTVTYRARY